MILWGKLSFAEHLGIIWKGAKKKIVSSNHTPNWAHTQLLER